MSSLRWWTRAWPGLLTLLSALGLVAAWPPIGLASLAFVALVPWLIALDRVSGAVRAVGLGLWLSLGMGLGTLYPVAHAFASYPEISWTGGVLAAGLTALLFQLQLPAFALLRGWLRPRVSARPWLAIGSSAGLYTGLDALLPKPFGDTLGLMFHAHPWWRQGADLGGPLVLTFVIVACNEALALALSRATPGDLRARLRPVLATAGAALVLWGYGGWRTHQWAARLAETDEHLTVGIVQANLSPAIRRAAEGGDDDAADQTLGTYLSLSDALIAHPEGPPDLLVWPETTYPGIFRRPFTEAQARRNVRLDLWVQARDVALVLGAYDGEAIGGELRQYNALFALSPAEPRPGVPTPPVAERYRKQLLFPFGETVPLLGDSPLARRLFPFVSFFGRGAGPRAMPVRTARDQIVQLGPTICYEDLFPSHARETVRLGAQLLINVSNDGWFGPYLVREFHLAHAVFRSVETRRPQIRATSSGISAIISPTGEITHRTAPLASETLRGRIPLVSEPPTPRRASLGVSSLAWLLVGLALLSRPR